MRKKRYLTVLLFLLLPLLTGMGGLGGTPDGGIPETQENIRAVVTDRQGVRTDLNQFSLEGKTRIEGSRGSGLMSVPFGQIAKVQFGEEAGEKVMATLRLRSGGTVDLQVGRRAVFYGSTGFGTFEIRARDLQQIDFR